VIIRDTSDRVRRLSGVHDFGAIFMRRHLTRRGKNNPVRRHLTTTTRHTGGNVPLFPDERRAGDYRRSIGLGHHCPDVSAGCNDRPYNHWRKAIIVVFLFSYRLYTFPLCPRQSIHNTSRHRRCSRLDAVFCCRSANTIFLVFFLFPPSLSNRCLTSSRQIKGEKSSSSVRPSVRTGVHENTAAAIVVVRRARG